jgi:cysteine-rich repeat protein
MPRWFSLAVHLLAVVVLWAPAADVVWAECGDGVPDVEEACNDGNRFGGDGCAENCTAESTRELVLDRGRSVAVTQLRAFRLPINIEGTLRFVIGQPGADGIVPVVIRSSDVSFPPIAVPGIACVCIRSDEVASDFGPGNVARGSLDCGSNEAALSDFTITQDHDTGDEDPGCSSGRIEAASGAHPGFCNGEVRFGYEFNGPRGSLAMADNISITQIADGGLCNVDATMQAKGPDGVPCTSDDPDPAPGRNVPVTTGRARATVYDADAVRGASITAGETCGGAPCVADLRGVPFDCDAILSSEDAGMDTGELVMAFPILHNQGAGDSVVTVRISPQRAPSCAGDCDGGGQVTVDELVSGVAIALGTARLDACPQFDHDANGAVEVNELVAAVGNALDGCS